MRARVRPRLGPGCRAGLALTPPPPAAHLRYYYIHRWFHTNKFVFTHFHAKHHAPVGNLDTHSSLYVDIRGGVVEAGLPIAALYAAFSAFNGNLWVWALAAHTAAALIFIGHTGLNM